MANETDKSASGTTDLGDKQLQSTAAPSVIGSHSDLTVSDTESISQEEQAAAESSMSADHPAVVVYGVPSGLGAAPANDAFTDTGARQALDVPFEDVHSVFMDLAESGYESLFSGMNDDLLKEAWEVQPAVAEPSAASTQVESFLLSGLDISDLIPDYDDGQSSSMSEQDAALFDHYLATALSPAGSLMPESVTIEIDDDPGTGVV